MPLPDANKKSPRVYPLLQNIDLENIAFATLQSTGTPIAIEEMNEDELRRLVLVNLARLSVKGEWSGLLTSSSGGSSQFPMGASSAPDAATTLFPGAIVQYPMFFPQTKMETTSNGWVRFDETQMNFFPFWVAKDGTMDSLTGRLVATNDDDLVVALYSNDSDKGVPETKIGTAVVWDMGAASGIITLDLSGAGDWDVEAGTLYWLGVMLETETTNRPTFYIFDTDEGPSWTIAANDTATEDYRLEKSSYYVTSLTAGTPPSTVIQPVSDIAYVPWITYTLA